MGWRGKGINSLLQPIVQDFGGKPIPPKEFPREGWIKVLDFEFLLHQIDVQDPSRITVHIPPQEPLMKKSIFEFQYGQ
jgi:hypothetical protein